MPIEILDLIDLAKALPADTDRAITTNLEGDAVIIRLEAGLDYPMEVHDHATETITALSGCFAILADGRSHAVRQGQCCRIPPGLAHRWAAESEAVVLVHFGTAV